MMEYKIIESNLQQLQETVKTMIKKDWLPQGGVAVDPATGLLYQAMVRYEADKLQTMPPIVKDSKDV